MLAGTLLDLRRRGQMNKAVTEIGLASEIDTVVVRGGSVRGTDEQVRRWNCTGLQ